MTIEEHAHTNTHKHTHETKRRVYSRCDAEFVVVMNVVNVVIVDVDAVAVAVLCLPAGCCLLVCVHVHLNLHVHVHVHVYVDVDVSHHIYRSVMIWRRHSALILSCSVVLCCVVLCWIDGVDVSNRSFHILALSNQTYHSERVIPTFSEALAPNRQSNSTCKTPTFYFGRTLSSAHPTTQFCTPVGWMSSPHKRLFECHSTMYSHFLVGG